jgi:alpha/beta superfamily hydrolase
MVTEWVQFPAGAFCLEGELAYPGGGRPRGAVVLAGPHPMLGGTRHNNVVRGLADALAGRGLATLRFDYRNSAGSAVDLARRFAEFWQTSHVSDEAVYDGDLGAAVEFLFATAGQLPLVVVGYSFGCTLLPAVTRTHSPDALVLIAPPIGIHVLDGFEELPQPKLVIAPRGDFAADDNKLAAWFGRLPGQRELLRPWFDGHFFRGHESWLADTVGSFIDRQWGQE